MRLGLLSPLHNNIWQIGSGFNLLGSPGLLHYTKGLVLPACISCGGWSLAWGLGFGGWGVGLGGWLSFWGLQMQHWQGLLSIVARCIDVYMSDYCSHMTYVLTCYIATCYGTCRAHVPRYAQKHIKTDKLLSSIMLGRDGRNPLTCGLTETKLVALWEARVRMPQPLQVRAGLVGWALRRRARVRML